MKNVDGSIKILNINSFLHKVFPANYYLTVLPKIINENYFQPRNDCIPVNLVFPIDWEQSSPVPEDRNWKMQLHSWNMFHPVMDIFDNVQEEEKNMYLEFFLKYIRDWYAQYGQDIVKTFAGRMPKSYAWYDMSVGFRALKLSFIVNRIVNFNLSISQENEEMLLHLIKQHVNHLSIQKVLANNNHRYWQLHGLIMLINIFGKNKLKQKYEYGINELMKFIEEQFSNDYTHLEHSPHYHFFVTDCLKKMILSGLYDNEPIILKMCHNVTDSQLWLVNPSGHCVAIGDSLPSSPVVGKFDTSIVPKDVDETKHTVSKLFATGGYAVIRTNWNIPVENSFHLFFMGAYHSDVHKHNDDMSFEWNVGGQTIILDSGKYGYKSDKFRNYVLSAKAHNIVEIDNFDIREKFGGIPPFGSCIQDLTEDNEIYTINAEWRSNNIKYSRHLEYRTTEATIFVNDRLHLNENKTLTQWFHIGLDFTPYKIEKNKIIFINENNKKLIIENKNNTELLLFYGYAEENDVQGFVCKADYKLEKGYVVGFKIEDVKEMEFNSVLRYE